MALLASAIFAWLFADVRAQLIDRILAVVAGEPITASDGAAALRLGLVPTPSPTADPGKDVPIDPVLEALIDRRLQLIEVNRYLPAEPSAAEIDARLARVRARFRDEADFAAALTETGVSASQLRGYIRDSLRIENYIQQRFGEGYQPGEDEMIRFYQANSQNFMRDGVARSYPEVRDSVRAQLVRDRSERLVREWIAGLRRRADVTILPR